MQATLIRNALVVDAEWTRKADVLIEGSQVAHIATHMDPSLVPEGAKVVDAHGLYLLPGLIDAHTHYHLVSRGTVTCDSFPEGSRLAAFGGVTTVVDFADDDKKGNLAACTEARLKEMEGGMAIDYSLHQGVYAWRKTLGAEMEALAKRGIRALKMFTTYKNIGYLVDDPKELRDVFANAKREEMMVCVHCEDEALLNEIQSTYQGSYNPPAHAVLRPSEVEARGIRTVGMIAHDLGMTLYVVHLSSKKGLEMVRYLRSIGTRVIVETTPTYLFLDRSLLEGADGSLFVMTPPLRDKDDNLALQEALAGGEIQVVATDHCAFTRQQKLSSNDCRTVYPGIPGTEELLPLLHTRFVKEGKITINQLVNLLSTGPAKAFGLAPRKGRVEVGSDADLVLFDPDKAWILSGKSLHSASGYTAYEGWKVEGKAVAVYRRGCLMVEGSEYYGVPGSGHFVPQGKPGQVATILH